MTQLSAAQYDKLERAIQTGGRIALFRRGTEYVVVPKALRLRDNREWIEALHPTTGEALTFSIDEVDRIEEIA